MKNKKKHKDKIKRIKKFLKDLRGVQRRNNELASLPKPTVTKDKKKEANKKACRKYKQTKED